MVPILFPISVGRHRLAAWLGAQIFLGCRRALAWWDDFVGRAHVTSAQIAR
jgi:hypothetical protein